MTRVINEYSKFLLEQWQKSFGVGHDLSLTAIRNRLDKLAKRYNKEVYTYNAIDQRINIRRIANVLLVLIHHILRGELFKSGNKRIIPYLT